MGVSFSDLLGGDFTGKPALVEPHRPNIALGLGVSTVLQGFF